MITPQQGVNPMAAQQQMTPEQKKAWDQLMLLLGGLGRGAQVPVVSSQNNIFPLLGGLKE